MILRQENLNIVIRSDHQAQPWIISIQPTVVSLQPNDTCGRVHCRNFHQATRVSQATLCCAVFEARRCMLLAMHLTRAYGVVYVKISDPIERWIIGRRIWLKYLESNLSMGLIHHCVGHLFTNKVDHPLKQSHAEVRILHPFLSHVLRRSGARDPNLNGQSVYPTKGWSIPRYECEEFLSPDIL